MKRPLWGIVAAAVAVVLVALVINSRQGREKESLTLIVSAGGSGQTFQAAAQHFTEATGIEVNVVQYPYAEVREKQLLELTSGTGNLDIVSVDGRIWLAELHPYLEPLRLEESDLGDFVPSMLDLFRYGQERTLYALPVRVGGWVLMYRKDLFDAAGLTAPKTWDDFLAAARRLTKGGVYGFAPALQQGNYLVAQWVPFLRSFGGELLTPDETKAAFNSPAGRKATQFFVDLYRKHKVVPPGAISYEHDGVIAAMQQGLAAMALTYSPNFLAMNDPEKSKVAGRLAVAPAIPYDPAAGLSTGITEISGWGFGIAKVSRHKEAAQKFIRFVTSREEQLRLALENTNAPTIKSVYTSSEYLTIFPAASGVAEALSSARSRPGVAVWTNVEDVLAAELSAALNGVKTVERALQDAETQVNRLLQS